MKAASRSRNAKPARRKNHGTTVIAAPVSQRRFSAGSPIFPAHAPQRGGSMLTAARSSRVGG